MSDDDKKNPRPLCKLCNTRHWSHEPHAWQKAAKAAAKKVTKKKPGKKKTKKQK